MKKILFLILLSSFSFCFCIKTEASTKSPPGYEQTIADIQNTPFISINEPYAASMNAWEFTFPFARLLTCRTQNQIIQCHETRYYNNEHNSKQCKAGFINIDPSSYRRNCAKSYVHLLNLVYR